MSVMYTTFENKIDHKINSKVKFKNGLKQSLKIIKKLYLKLCHDLPVHKIIYYKLYFIL